MRKGSQPRRKPSSHDGIDAITGFIDLTVKIAIASSSFQHPVNVGIDENDEPYYGMDKQYLINAPFDKFRGTDRTYRFASLESGKNNE